MFVYVLTFMACLGGQGDRCQNVELPWDGSLMQCMLFGQQAAQWTNEHPGWALIMAALRERRPTKPQAGGRKSTPQASRAPDDLVDVGRGRGAGRTAGAAGLRATPRTARGRRSAGCCSRRAARPRGMRTRSPGRAWVLRVAEAQVHHPLQEVDELVLVGMDVRRHEGARRVQGLEAEAVGAVGLEEVAVAEHVPGRPVLPRARRGDTRLPASIAALPAGRPRSAGQPTRCRPDRHDLELALGQPADLARLAAQQGAGDRRGPGDPPGGRLGLVLADDGEA